MRSLIASPRLEVRKEISYIVSRYGICDNTDRAEGIFELLESAYADEGPYDAVFIDGFADGEDIVGRVRALEDKLSGGAVRSRIIAVATAKPGSSSADAHVAPPICEENVHEALGPLAPRDLA